MPRRGVVALVALLVLAAVAAALAGHGLATYLLGRLVSLASGYDVSFGDQRIGWNHAVFTDVRVRVHGDPLLDAQRIDVEYALRDLFPGGHRRYGFVSAAVQQPLLTIVRHADGSFNLAPGGVAAQPPTPTKRAATPLLFTARVRDGTILLVDRAPPQPDLATQSIVDVNIDATVNSETRTTARITGSWVGRRNVKAPDQRWPIEVRSTIDDERGFAIHRLRAPGLPIRGALAFLLHSPVARFDDGTLQNVDVMAYALDVHAEEPIGYRLGGGAQLSGGRLSVGPLARPVDDLQGTIHLYDDGVATTALTGTLAGIPLRVRGGFYDFGTPRFRVGIAADGDLRALRTAFAFTADQPIRGPAHLEILVTSRVDRPLIRTAFSSSHLQYDTIPIDRADAVIDYADDKVSIGGGRARYGPIAASLDGDVVTNDPHAPMRFLLRAVGPTDAIPYAQQVAGGAAMEADAIVVGTADGGFHAGGTFAATGPEVTGDGFVSIDERGVGEFGPFAFRRRDGSSLVGTLRLERPISSSAVWLAARRFRIDVPRVAAVLPGLTMPEFPPLGGTLDAAIVAGGPPENFALAGTVHGSGVRYDQIAIGTVRAQLAGTLTDLRLRGIDTRGPLGTFRGDGAYADGTFALAGRYEGSLSGLESFTGPMDAAGRVRTPIAALFNPGEIVFQSAGAQLDHATVRGIQLDRAALTVALSDAGVRVVAADADLAGARIVAAARSAGAVAVSAVGVPVGALRGAGLPLQAGHLSLFGTADLRGPRFRGAVDLEDGVAAGFGVHGWADLAFSGTTLDVTEGIGAVGQTYGRIGGRVDGITGGAPRYQLDAAVPLGDVATLVRDLRLPIDRVAGSYGARLQVAGSGASPLLAGTVEVPEASFHGVPLRDGSALLSVATAGATPALGFRNGRVTVGSTAVSFDGAVNGSRLALHAASPAADLSDLDGYFVQSNVLAGRGAFDASLTSDGKTTASAGRLTLTGARFARFALGTVALRWSTADRRIGGEGSVAGAGGSLNARGSVVPGSGTLIDAFRFGQYDVALAAAGVDLGSWLPAAGFTLPVFGRVDADGHLTGTFPQLALEGNVALRDGIVGAYAVSSARARVHLDAERLRLEDAAADLGIATLSASGSVALSPRGPLDLHVHAAAPDINAALRRGFPRTTIPVTGALELDATAAGTRERPQLTAGVALERATVAGLAVPQLLASLRSDLRGLDLNSAEINLGSGGSLVLAGRLPLTLQPFGLGASDAPLSLSLESRGIDLAAFGPFVPGGGAQLGGTLDGRLALEGTVGRPRLLGDLSVRDASFVSDLQTAPINNITGAFAFRGTSVALQAFHADVGGGTLDASGELTLPIPGAPNTGFAIEVAARGARLNFPAWGGGRLDGTARIVSGGRLPTLGGDVTISDATIPFAAIFRAAGGGEQAASGPALDLGLDLVGHVGKNVRIRSPIIDVGVTGDLNLGGTLRSPQVGGVLSATRGGIFSTYQRAFRIQEAQVRFDPSQGIVPRIDLRATAHISNPDPDPERNPIGSADITVTVTGPADGFTINFASDPPYPEAQIIGLLVGAQLFGAVNFNAATAAGVLRGAPGESNVLLPPGVTPYLSGNFSFQQEVFSLLNTQATQHLLAPVERTFGTVLGLDDFSLTVDFGGRLGYTARRTIAPRNRFAATISQIISYPTRTQIGFDMRPDAATTVSFLYFWQASSPSLTLAGAGAYDRTLVLTGIQPYSNRQGFRLVARRRYP
jgi:hypothetical protein